MYTRHLYIFLLMLVCFSCEKLDTSTESNVNQQNQSQSEANAPICTVADILTNKIQAGTEVWLTGYIVGYVNSSTINSVQFSAGDKTTNVILADCPLETNNKNCIPIQLNANSSDKAATQSALNLAHHPENLKQKVKILGKVSTYMSVVGLKDVKKYAFLEDNFDYETYYREHPQPNNNTTDDEDVYFDDEDDENLDEEPYINTGNPDNNDNTNNPRDETIPDEDILAKQSFTVSDIIGPLSIAMQENGILTIPHCFVEGYIVGYIKTNNISKTNFTSDSAVETNIVLADSPGETDTDKCIAIQLSSSSSYILTRNALNLKANPENLGKRISVYGTIEKYMGRLGLKNTSRYKFE